MHGDALARWARRHPEGRRLLAAFQANDLALHQAIERLRIENPDATLADVRRYLRRMRGAP